MTSYVLFNLAILNKNSYDVISHPIFTLSKMSRWEDVKYNISNWMRYLQVLNDSFEIFQKKNFNWKEFSKISWRLPKFQSIFYLSNTRHFLRSRLVVKNGTTPLYNIILNCNPFWKHQKNIKIIWRQKDLFRQVGFIFHGDNICYGITV